MRLRDKIGIITGAASGMGRAGALLMSAEGAAIAVVDRDPTRARAVADEVTAAGGRAIAIIGDLTDDEFSARIVADTVSEFGGLDFVWCHAGHPGPKEFEGINLVDYELAMTLNVRTALVTTAAAIPELRKRGGGSVVFTSSTNGVRGSPNSPVYAAGKFGIIGVARSLAKRYGAEKIRFNSICPGVIDTPMLHDFFTRGGPSIPQEEVDRIKKTRIDPIPLKRLGQPEDIAWTAVFLVSDESSFITGTEICVDGGTTA